MIDTLLSRLAPHHCCGCGKIGTILCQDCEYNIVSEPYVGCVVCSKPTVVGICSRCVSVYTQAWCVGDREDTLERLIDAYKFKRAKAAANTLASLLDEVVPILPKNTVIVPVPTARSHVRVRGYDHALLLARIFARKRGLSVASVVMRRGGETQRGLNKKMRMKQAEQTFYCSTPLPSGAPYLLIDDIVTTNATLRYAATALKDAGAETVWAAVVARQPLKKVN